MYSVRVPTSGTYSVEAKIDCGPMGGIIATAQTVTVQAWTGAPDRVELLATVPAYPATLNCGDNATATVSYSICTPRRAAVCVDPIANITGASREPRGYMMLDGPASGTTSIVFTCEEACVDTGMYSVVWDLEGGDLVVSNYVPAQFTWRESSWSKCIANLRQLDGAIQQCIIEEGTSRVSIATFVPRYLKTVPTCPIDGKAYVLVTNDPDVTVVCPNFDATNHPAKL